MAVYKFDVNGNRVELARYLKRELCTTRTMFPTNKDTTGKLVVPKVKCDIKTIYRAIDKSDLVRYIFNSFIWKIIEKIADGHVFVFPGKAGVNICLKKLSDWEVRAARSRGAYKEIDIIKSGLTIPRFVYDFGPKNPKKDCHIYVPRRLSLRAYRNVENGLIPWTQFRKSI